MEKQRQAPKSRRATFALAAVLAAATLTAGAAVTGLAHDSAPSGATQVVHQAPAVVQQVPVIQQPAYWEGSD